MSMAKEEIREAIGYAKRALGSWHRNHAIKLQQLYFMVLGHNFFPVNIMLRFVSNSYWCLTFVHRVEGWKMHQFHVPSMSFGSKIHGLISLEVCICFHHHFQL